MLLTRHFDKSFLSRCVSACRPSPQIRVSALLLAVAWILGVIPSSSFNSSAADGDWPMWRHDAHLSGYQPLPGAMTEAPRVRAKHMVGAGAGVQTFADLRGTGQ